MGRSETETDEASVKVARKVLPFAKAVLDQASHTNEEEKEKDEEEKEKEKAKEEAEEIRQVRGLIQLKIIAHGRLNGFGDSCIFDYFSTL